MKNVLMISMAGALLVGCAAPNTISPQGSSAEVQKEQHMQRELAFKRIIKEDKRVKDVAYPVLSANAPLCEDTAYNAGVFFWNQPLVPKEYQEIVKSDYGLGDNLQIQEIYKGSPASKSGLKVGDELLAINGKKIPSGERAAQKAMELMESVQTPEISLTISRNGKEIEKAITRKKICDYGVVYNPDDQSVNAFADGENIHITRGMLRFVDNDTELALVVSHELAHNAMGHMDKKRTNAMAAGAGGLLIDILFAAAGVNTQGTFTDAASKAGVGAYSVEFEQEADYVGMYFMERAGYRTNGVANFWRRMSAENASAAIDVRTSHPTTPERFVAIEKTREEIQRKKSKGQKLAPEIKLDSGTEKRVKVKTAYNS